MNLRPRSLLHPQTRVRRLLRFVPGLIVLGPIAVFLWRLPSLDVAWSPDTFSYVALVPYLQPLYGYFFRSLSLVGMQERQIAFIQVVLFALSMTFLFLEARRTHIPTLLLFGLGILWLFPLTTHFCSSSASFMSEAISYPLLVTFCALCLRLRRVPSEPAALLATSIIVLVLFVREAALPYLPATAAAFALVTLFGNQRVRPLALRSLVLVVALTGIFPILLNRPPWQVRPPLDRSGITFLPRVVMLPAELSIPEPSRSQWSRLNASFIEAGSSLSCVERALFESQLQEAVRYHLGPRVLLGTSETLLPAAPVVRASNVADQTRSFTLFKQAVLLQKRAYLKSSLCHFLAVLTAGTHVGTASRQSVFRALQQVDPETWELSPFRTDYPLNRFDVPLKHHTELAYGMFRLAASAGTLAGCVGTVGILLFALLRRRRLNAAALSWLLLTGCLLGHSLLVALSIFSDPRFVMANFIMQWTLLCLSLDLSARLLAQSRYLQGSVPSIRTSVTG